MPGIKIEIGIRLRSRFRSRPVDVPDWSGMGHSSRQFAWGRWALAGKLTTTALTASDALCPLNPTRFQSPPVP